MERMIIQITAGRGPLECCRVVAKVQGLMLKQAKKQGLRLEVLENKLGQLTGTLLSTAMMLTGNCLEGFLEEWVGTVQWVAPSPYRKYHKRKNWFVGVATFDVKELLCWDVKEVKIDTCRSAGPGGQHVNKVETAVRAKHLPSGIPVVAMDSRSQLENKKACLARLEAKVLVWQTEQLLEQQQDQWQAHNELERGNAVKTIKQELF